MSRTLLVLVMKKLLKTDAADAVKVRVTTMMEVSLALKPLCNDRLLISPPVLAMAYAISPLPPLTSNKPMATIISLSLLNMVTVQIPMDRSRMHNFLPPHRRMQRRIFNNSNATMINNNNKVLL